MALSSMTGFARRDGVAAGAAFLIEARSVNGRGLEVRLRAPAGLEGLERHAREAAAQRFSRGQIGLQIRIQKEEGRGGAVFRPERLEELLALAARYAEAPGVRPASLGELLALPGVFVESRPEAEVEALETALAAEIGRTLDALKASREEEGAALAAVLVETLERVEALLAAAEAAGESQPRLIRERLERRMTELARPAAAADARVDGAALAERIALEASALAVRADVREELDRLRLHIAAGRKLIREGGATGRRLDFLAQEFMREANTLGSKAVAPELTERALDLKAVVDQLREQVQNVE